MSAETDLIAMLNSAPELAGKRIFLNAADEQTPLPYIVVTASHDIDVMLDGAPDTDHVTFTIASWGASASAAEGLCDDVSTVLETEDAYAVTARIGGFDQETGDDVAVLTADIWTTAGM